MTLQELVVTALCASEESKTYFLEIVKDLDGVIGDAPFTCASEFNAIEEQLIAIQGAFDQWRADDKACRDADRLFAEEVRGKAA